MIEFLKQCLIFLLSESNSEAEHKGLDADALEREREMGKLEKGKNLGERRDGKKARDKKRVKFESKRFEKKK